tara:strand:+ start:67 stop:654 length:588 start_codon:yes stop_codon:yes gene_type:complete
MALTVVKTTALSGTITNAQLAGSIDLTAKVTGTLPAANGGTGVTSYAPGKILQVIGATSNTTYDTSSTSQVETMTATITPTSTSNKVLVYFSVPMCEASNTSHLGEYFLIRDISGGASTDLLTGGQGSTLATVDAELARNDNSPCAMYLDSPSTTSATTYKVNIAVSNATMNVRWNRHNTAGAGTMFMVLQEVAG